MDSLTYQCCCLFLRGCIGSIKLSFRGLNAFRKYLHFKISAIPKAVESESLQNKSEIANSLSKPGDLSEAKLKYISDIITNIKTTRACLKRLVVRDYIKREYVLSIPCSLLLE